MSVNKFLIWFPSLATMMICYQMYVIIVKTKPDIIYTWW